MSNHLIPDHLIALVLLRLPFDSLIRFKCVSKSWRDLIHSPYFIQLHSQRSKLNQPHSHPDAKIIALKGTSFYPFDSLVPVGRACTAIAKELNPPPTEFSERGLEIIGSSDGILCLWNFWTDDVALWNPWIQKYFALPSPPFEFTKKYRGSLGAAFGYDHVNEDYKVVKWHIHADFCLHLNDLPSSRRYELCLYSRKLNSWRRIKGAIPFELPQYHDFFPWDCAFANGALHWHVTDVTRRVANFIVAFDLGSHEFRKISTNNCSINAHYPHTYKHKCCCLNGYGIGGGLALVRSGFSSRPERSGGEIWVMEEYGVESSWTKLASIDFPPDLRISEFKPVAYSKKQRKMVLQVGWENLVVYYLKKKKLREVSINGEVTCFSSCVCVGSLVSP